MLAKKEHAYRLLDQMSPVQITAVVSLLEVMVDPVVAALAAAPVDDEPAAALDRPARESGTPHEKFLSELGLSQSEVEASGGF